MKIRFILLIASFFLVCSCGHKNRAMKYSYASKEEKDALEKFFRNLLFLEGGAYTLLGSKPITIFDLIEVDQTIIDLNELLPDLPSRIFINKNNEADMKLYHSLNSQQKRRATIFSDKDYIFDTVKLWKTWEQFCTRLDLSNKYLLFKTEYTSFEKEDLDPSCNNGYHITFVNVLKTACLLNQHYEIFKQAFGSDFDPIEETLNITNPDSKLWKFLHSENPQDYYQEVGLLLGYGFENTQIFKWKNTSNNNFFQQIKGSSASNLNETLQNPHPFSSNNFPLPTFITYFPINTTQVQYTQEKSQIMQFYQNKDLVEATLDVLTDSQQ